MPLDQLLLRDVFPTTAENIYAMWMDPDGHARMTGGAATIDAREGGEFTAWDGYISGTNETLEPGRRIVQRWRTTEFPDDAQHSRLEVMLRPVDDGCELTLVHTEIPEGQGERYEDGWVEYYFKPLRELIAAATPAPVAKKTAATKSATAKKPVSSAKASARPKKPAKRAAAKKAASKPAAKRAAGKKATSKSAAKRGAAKKAVRKPVAKKAGKKAPAKKSVKRTAAKKRPVARKAARKKSAKRAPARRVSKAKRR